MDENKCFDSDKLEKFTSDVFQKLGIPQKDAYITAKILINSDLRGIESHGIAHLKPFYVNWIKQGKIRINPNLKLTSNSLTTAILDGDFGLGFIAGYHAMIEAIKRAKKYGVGFVSVKNSTHFGAASYYAMMPLKDDMIGIALSSGGRLMMTPCSSERAGGANPIAIAVPSYQKHPFVLDMSTTVVAYGKIEIAKRQGKNIPEGWVIDENGNSVTDVSDVSFENKHWKGGLLPLGGDPNTGAFKGYGLSVFIDILCTLLSGAPLNTTMNHFFGAIRIDGFRQALEFKQQMDQLIVSIENLPKLPGVKKLYVAGGLADEIMHERGKRGIPLDKEVISSLKKLSKELTIIHDLEF